MYYEVLAGKTTNWSEMSQLYATIISYSLRILLSPLILAGRWAQPEGVKGLTLTEIETKIEGNHPCS